MKVLFLPINIASVPFITTEAINKIDGIEAVCITNLVSPIQSRGANTIVIPDPKKFPRKKLIQWLYHKLTYRAKIKKWINWADVLHYTWSTAIEDGEDLKLAVKMNKPVFIEWLGSDIRKPDYLKKRNKYYAEVFDQGYEYKELESSDHSEKVQKQFGSVKAIPLLNPEMSMYLDHKYFPDGAHITMPRLNVKSFTPKYPQKDNPKPLIIHSPSARVCKGTKYVLQAVNELKKKYDFDFKLIENMPRKEALDLMSRCDIFIDQLILGSYGLASIEAMSFGKPVVCYIMPEVFNAGLPADCPIVNANPDDITTQLEKLIVSASDRYEIGKKGRDFAAKYHDADRLVEELATLYRNELEKKNARI